MRKRSIHIPKGMTKDLSASKFSSEYYYDALNIKLAPGDSNTLLSITNIKSNRKIPVQFIDKFNNDITSTGKWDYLGHVVLNSYIAVFASRTVELGEEETDTEDYIYKIDTTDNTAFLLAQGKFNFSTSNPIEGIGIYEKEGVQKVYWVDGINQPRMINITPKLPYTPITDSTELDFVRVQGLNEKVTIKRNETTIGYITAGTIQYVFTYYDLYGQESNIFYQSPLYYISYNNRGASPEDTSVSASFTITLKELDNRFDYVRIYSIHRGSTNNVPECRRVIDLPVNSTPQTGDIEIVYVDDGTSGDAIDPSVLLYIGGKEVIPYTMEHKDGTLFMGNYQEKGSLIPDTLKSAIRNNTITFGAEKELIINNENPTSSFYSYKHQLASNSRQITTYKYGETYRFGIQFQKPTGEWSEPVFINDAKNTVAPQSSIQSQSVMLSVAKCEIPSTQINQALEAGYVKARPVVVFPTIADRTVICQGVLNPTVFNVGDRYTNSPFAQASWFFRPNYSTFNTDNATLYPVRSNCVLISTYVLWPNNLPTRGTKVYLVRKDNIEDEEGVAVDAYTFFGIIRMTSSGNPVDVAVLLNEYSASTSNTQVPYSWYFLSSSATGTVANNFAQITIPPQNNETPEWMYIDRWYMGLPEGLQSTDSSGRLSWDSNYGWKSNPYVLSHSLVTHDYATYTASWATSASSLVTVPGTLTQFVHYQHLPYSNKKNGEIQCNYHDEDIQVTPATDNTSYVNKFADMFFVDQSIVTLNSPEIDFDTSMQAIEDSSLKLRIVGCIPITATIGDLDISTSTPQLNYYNTANISNGFWHEYTGMLMEPGCYGLNVIPAWFDEVYGYTYNGGSNTASMTFGYAIYPWHRSGSMNNQPSATLTDDDLIKGQSTGYRSAVLKRKVMSNMRFSANTLYNVTGNSAWDAGDVAIGLFNSNEVTNIRLSGQTSYGSKDINYYGNVDKVLTSPRKYNSKVIGYPIFATYQFMASDTTNYYHNTIVNSGLSLIGNDVSLSDDYQYGYDPISMRYKSNPHAVICMRGEENTVKVLPRFDDADATAKPSEESMSTFWTELLQVSQDEFSAATAGYGYLWLGEIYNDMHSVDNKGNLVKDGTPNSTSTRFGGQTNDAVESNIWVPGGEAVTMTFDTAALLKWTEGDTYYQRYDCLKTYPFSTQDTNSIVDICSFMVETHVNIEGRYDRNRGQLSNLTMSPQNFNLINPGYTQLNNFFNYKILDSALFDEDYYPNYITWSKTKTPGEKIDTWTNVTLANVLDLDGDKGDIQSLKRFNNDLYCFQDRGISQILYNERVQLSTTDGVPVELANSDKVDGKRYLTETIGCQNKWSITTSPYGLYFIDANNKTINRLSQGIEDLTNIFGFNSWAENNIELGVWKPSRTTQGVYRSFYDGNNKDVFFIGGHGDNDCLVYSETMNQFTSFYSWGKALDIFNVDDNLFSFEDSTLPGLYKQYKGSDFCRFFGTAHPFHITYINAEDPLNDKIYTNIEFRATVEGDGEYISNTGKFTPTLPFDTIDVWDEYQHGRATLLNRNGHSAMLHHQTDNNASLKRKFRLWRCDVPRDNAPLTADEGLDITRFKTRPIDRIRNPWAYFKLTKNAEHSDKQVQLHDFTVDYFL